MDAARTSGARRWLVWTVTFVAGLLGLAGGFDFGLKLNGSMMLGALLALNGALCCSIIAAAAAERVLGDA